MAIQKHITTEQALQKLRQFCAYSERCHSDVTEKLYALGVWKKDHDTILATLIEENYLNEERFARLFAGSHFRQKQWGRNKIKKGLQLKKISSYCIAKAMTEIDEADYAAVLKKLFEKKWQSLSHEKNRFFKMRKTADYLLQKGYEPELFQPLFQQY